MVKWLQKEVKGPKLIALAILVFLAEYCYQLSLLGLIQRLGWPIPERWIWGIPEWIPAPIRILLEEVVFRAPLALFYKKPRVALVVAIILALAFGWGHGGIPYVGIHAMAFPMNLLFLKCGGLQGKLVKPFLVLLSIHLLHDWMIDPVVDFAYFLGIVRRPG